MVQHKLDNLEDFKRHHVLAHFKDVLHSVCLVQVDLDELLDCRQCAWNRDLALLDGVLDVGRVEEVLLVVSYQLVPYTCL